MIFNKSSERGEMGYKPVERTEYSYQKRKNSAESPIQNMFEEDLAVNLLGKSFVEIKEILGEPDEEGHSKQRRGLHNYIMRFRHKDGAIIFSSPKDMKNKIAVSIILV